MENRTLRILEAIVDEYIRTGEAVGSKLIAEKLDNAVSSATIRNEMAALEQQGYLEHTHTSSGRLPTYQGACGYHKMRDSFYQHRKQVFGHNKGRRYPDRQENVRSATDNLRGQHKKQGLQTEL